jgi:hypothetical protein
MSRSVDRAAIDRVLKDAVDAGAVPHVAAIAADADGVFYEAGFGPCVAGQDGEVTASTDFAGMSMTKMVVRCSWWNRAASTLTLRSTPTVPSSPRSRCSRASTATHRGCARRQAAPLSGT